MAETVFDRARIDPRLVADALAPSQLAPFWGQGLDSPRHPRYAGRTDWDLVVVGAGYAGLWTALLASERDPDARIALVEARTVGWAASGRNGGFCEATLTHHRTRLLWMSYNPKDLKNSLWNLWVGTIWLACTIIILKKPIQS